jgi:hypothetical protein
VNPKLSTLFAMSALALVTGLASPASANFAADPTRKDSANFTRFFLKRFDKWFSANVADPRKGLEKAEIAFLDEFLRTTPSFGIKTADGFLRTVLYGVRVENEKVMPGPFRFLLADSQSALKDRILVLAKAKGVALEKSLQTQLAGVGFTGLPNEIELIFKDETGSLLNDSLRKTVIERPVWVHRLYRAGKLVANEYLEIDVDSRGPCPGSTSHAQIDRVTDDEGKSSLSCHTSQFEDQAVSPAARALTVKIRRGLNIVPGALEVSGTRMRAFYP